ncbi:hypothetical protein QBZ16_002608 [Prototheca wickerhamii]|uniref:Protein HGH1 N-terminal domain-containing protein n=1 Tax=Prototheca wickerhamii TaxID=3111 RepID=A0AAD9MLZ3_PROWI|nr:hypothetical protein QBZ16_002608 [Prototheca wickerhamii]
MPQLTPPDELQELIEFLSDKRALLRGQAAELVEGLTGSPEGIATLANRAETLLPPLLRLIPDTAPISRSALVALVNLAQEPAVLTRLLALNACARAMDYLREGACENPALLITLLANLTASEEGSRALLQLGEGTVEGLHIATLLKLFTEPVLEGEEDTCEHVATILPNLTRFEAARRLLLEPGRGLLQALASQLRSPSELRARGSARALKNCLFAAESDGTVPAVMAEEAALRTALAVLAGGESEARKDDEVREALAEAVLCLARNDDARKLLWKLDAPELLRTAYEYEERPATCAALEATAELFLSDGLLDPATGTLQEPVPEDAATGQRSAVSFEELE